MSAPAKAARPLRVLCLFSSAPLRDASFFGAEARHWTSELEEGPCEFVPLVVDGEVEALATSGLFAAATLLCRAADLEDGLAPSLRAAGRAFAAAGVPFELVAADAPVSVLGWLAGHAPDLAPRCRNDGEVRADSPSWWRERARRHLAPPVAPPPTGEGEPEDLGAELAAFVARRGW